MLWLRPEWQALPFLSTSGEAEEPNATRPLHLNLSLQHEGRVRFSTLKHKGQMWEYQEPNMRLCSPFFDVSLALGEGITTAIEKCLKFWLHFSSVVQGQIGCFFTGWIVGSSFHIKVAKSLFFWKDAVWGVQAPHIPVCTAVSAFAHNKSGNGEFLFVFDFCALSDPSFLDCKVAQYSHISTVGSLCPSATQPLLCYMYSSQRQLTLRSASIAAAGGQAKRERNLGHFYHLLALSTTCVATIMHQPSSRKVMGDRTYCTSWQCRAEEARRGILDFSLNQWEACHFLIESGNPYPLISLGTFLILFSKEVQLSSSSPSRDL